MTSEKPKVNRIFFFSTTKRNNIWDQLNNVKKSKELELNELIIQTILHNESKIRSAVMSRSLQ